MTLQTLGGDGLMLHDFLAQTSATPSFSSGAVMDASTEKVALVGCIYHPTIKTGTINIRKVHFRIGALTFNVASTIRCSLQSVSATAGPPYQPDGTQDQTYDFASGTGLTANAWNSTGNLSADRAVDLTAVNLGDANSRWVAVVFEYAVFTAADSFILSGLASSSGNGATEHLLGGSNLLNTAAWAASNVQGGIIAFELDDGSFAFMEGTRPVSATSTASVGNAAAIRAAGLKFKFPVEVKIDGIGLGMGVQNGADGTLTLYDSDGTTVLASVVIDNDGVISTVNRIGIARIVPITLAANTFYRLAFVATVATTTTIPYVNTNSAALMDGLTGGQNFHWTQRDSAGVWTDTTTQRPLLMLRLSAIHDGTGGGGGLAMPVSGRICA